MTHNASSQPDRGMKNYTPSVEERLVVPVYTAIAATSLKSPPKVGVPTSASQAGQPLQSSSVAGSKPMTSRRKLTPIKRLERYVSAIFKLGRIEYMAKDARKRVTHGELRMDDIEAELGQFGREIQDISRSISEFQNMLDDIDLMRQTLDQNKVLTDSLINEFRIERAHWQTTLLSETSLMARVFADLSRRLDQISQRSGKPADDFAKSTLPIDLPASDGFEAFKDSFYHRLENRYRGSVDEIMHRLRIYLPDAEAAVIRTGGKPVMDLGCGRGEWLYLLERAGLEGFGVDTNAVQIEEAKEKGLDIRQGDALKALAAMADDSLAFITAHHLIEHLPFDAVAWITREAMRVLAPGGVLLFETPNTRNVLVGATTFHTDPTHLKPMPEQVLSVLFETVGFNPVEVRHLNAHERFDEFLAQPDVNDELAVLLFGPQDLAVLGTKKDKD